MQGRKGKFAETFGSKYFVFELEDWAFSAPTARTRLCKHFEIKSLKGFGVDHLETAITSAGAIMAYLELTQHKETGHITRLSRIEEDHFVRMDKFTVRNLELLRPMADDGRSLLDVIDRTLSPMGARLLRRWLLFPLRSVKMIQQRQDGVEYFFKAPEFAELCTDCLGRVGDVERLVSKAAVGRINPRELQQLRLALESIALIKRACEHADNEQMRAFGTALDAC